MLKVTHFHIQKKKKTVQRKLSHKMIDKHRLFLIEKCWTLS